MKLPSVLKTSTRSVSEQQQYIRDALVTGEMDIQQAMRYAREMERLAFSDALSDELLYELSDEDEPITLQSEIMKEYERALESWSWFRGSLVMEFMPASAPPPSAAPDPAPPPSGSLGRIRWKGKTKADLGRVFAILAPLMDCTGADWERHFMGREGEDMTGATDLHNSGMTSQNGTVQALAAAVKKMEPEKE